MLRTSLQPAACTLAVAVYASGASAAGVYQDPAGEFRTPLPAGWTVGREAMSKQVCEGTATDIRSGRDPITQLNVRTCAVNLDAASLREGYYRGKPQARAQDEEVAAELRGSNAAMLRELQGLSEQLAAQKSTLRQQVENPATAPEARQAAQAKLQQTEAMLKEAAEMQGQFRSAPKGLPAPGDPAYPAYAAQVRNRLLESGGQPFFTGCMNALRAAGRVETSGKVSRTIDGEPSANLSDPRAAFPPPLVQQQSAQRADAAVVPLAADIRDGSEVVLQKKVLRTLRSEVLRLLAPMLGCAYDELVRRHHQRLVKRALAAASGLSAILLVVAATSTFGFLAERHARKTTEDLLGKQSELLAVTEPGCDINRRWTFARLVEQQMESYQADSATQEAARQKVLSVAYGMQMMLAKEAGEAEYHDEAFEKARQQSVPLTIAQLRAFYPTFSSDLADLWVMTKTRPAAWLTDQKALALQFEHNAEIETWKGRLAIFDQLSDMAVTRKWAAEYTGLVAEFLQQKLLDLSIAEGRNSARRLLQRCREMWALAAHKQLLTEREQALVLEVQRALRRLGEN